MEEGPCNEKNFRIQNSGGRHPLSDGDCRCFTAGPGSGLGLAFRRGGGVPGRCSICVSEQADPLSGQQGTQSAYGADQRQVWRKSGSCLQRHAGPHNGAPVGRHRLKRSFHYKKPYNYFVNNEKSFNAFCTVGHNLSVNIGTFDKLNYNENEIAFVVAHEIGHGQKQHPAAGVKRGLPLSLLAALYSSQNPNAASIIGATLVNALGTARLVTLPMEKEADRLAFDYAVAAGYNVGGGAALWQHILERNGKESSGFASVFNDHPTSVSRRDEYSRRITKWSGNAVKVEKDTGAITVQGKHFYTPAKTTSLSSAEQAYLIAGNLAAVYHNKANSRTVWTNGAHMLMVGDQPIMTLNGVANAATVQRRLQDILQDKKVQDKKVQTAKVRTKAAAEKKSDSKKRAV